MVQQGLGRDPGVYIFVGKVSERVVSCERLAFPGEHRMYRGQGGYARDIGVWGPWGPRSAKVCAETVAAGVQERSPRRGSSDL